MRNIFKGMLDAKVYEFPDAEEFWMGEDPPEPVREEPAEAPPPEPDSEPDSAAPEPERAAPPEEGETAAAPVRESGGPVQYAQLQAELILKQAREEAEEILAEARASAMAEQETIRIGARDEGYREGYAQGMAKAMDDAERDREAVAARLEKDLQEYLEKADMAREELIGHTQDELLDLCIAVAEKVVRVSLKSSSEVIVRMIQAATERLKRQEWVHIYISGCDTKGVARITPALTTALGALSQHIKIIPMGDDEGGTCIVETPEEIIDASVSTQMTNIRDLLRDQMGGL